MNGELFIPLFGVIGFFGSIIAYVYMRYKTQHEERMALIESGQSAEIFSSKSVSNSSASLRTGLFFIGLGLGFVMGLVLETTFGWYNPAGVIPMSFVGGGLGYVIHYMVTKDKED